VSFVILRHAKIKSSARGAVISHNHRLSDEIEKINIDAKQGHLNRSLMGQGAMQRLNEKLPSKMRKDAVIAIETLITASPEFFDAIEKDRSKLSENPKFKKWVVDSQIWMKKEWGDNVVDAVLHMDESSPHIHFLTVPLMQDGRLCAKDFLALGVMQRHQTEYAKAMESHGLERGLSVKETKRRHIGLKEAPAGSGGQASQLAAQLAATQAELAVVNRRFDRLLKAGMNDASAISELKKKAGKLTEELAISEAKVATLTTENSGLKKAYQEEVAEAKKQASEHRQLQAQYDGYKKAAEAARTAQEPPKELIEARVPVIDQQALEAFEARWEGLSEATAGQVAAGTIKDVFGRQVVLHVGQGKHVLHTVPKGQAIPKMPETQQQKGGIAR